MESHICLLTAGPTGTETLKNLVLPGCGRITVVDAARVTQRDLGNNFFVTPDSVGRSRAQVTLELLLEMNADVKGDYHERDPLELLREQPTFFAGYSLVIATQMPEAALRTLAAALWAQGVPLLAVRSFGLVGTLRLAKGEHTMVESRLEKPQPGLRISAPFPALSAFVAGVDVGALDDMTLAHTPFVVLLLTAAEQWRKAHGGAAPASAADKEAFKASVASIWNARPDVAAGGGGVDRCPAASQPNFIEAEGCAYLSWARAGVPEGVEEVLEDGAAEALTPASPDFWVVARAIRDFVRGPGAGQLPVPGTIPDMTASTELFLALQRTYTAKAAEDLAAVSTRVRDLSVSLGRAGDAVPPAFVALMCKHAGGLRRTRYRSVEEECSAPNVELLAEELGTGEMDEGGGGGGGGGAATQHPLAWYLCLRAVDRFAASTGRYPGSSDEGLEADGAALWAAIQALGRELGLPCTDKAVGSGITPAHAAEMCRYGGTELHAVAAFMGGVAAQEAVKLLTAQYVPLDNTFVHNAISGTSGTYCL